MQAAAMRIMQQQYRHAGGTSIVKRICFMMAGALLAACSTTMPQGTTPDTANVETFDNIGTGSVKVALLLPMSATGNAGKTATALKQAAELALFEFNNPDILLIPKDTQGTAQGAAAAAQQAVAEGAELIVGPLFSHSVAAVGPIARQANIPVIAFSTDSNVAGRGVYLLSFLPQEDVAQIVAFAAGKGKRSFAGLVPETAYGTLVESALRQAAATQRAAVIGVEKYPLDRQAMIEPAKRLAQAAVAQNADAILIPDGPAVLPSLAPLLTLNGLKTSQVKLLGSGQWDDPAVGREPTVVGGWYAAPDPKGWNSFVTRYQATFGAEPPRIATLAYDAVSLAAALARQPQGQRFTEATLTNSSGFNGVDGIFRFTANGLNQRGLAIHEVQSGGGSKVIAAAPKSFAARSF